MNIWMLAFVNAIRKLLFNFMLFIPGMEHPALIKKENKLTWVIVIIFVAFLFWLTLTYS